MQSGTRNRLLGWPQLVAALVSRTRTLFGRESIDALAPLPDRAAIEARLADVEALRTLHGEGDQSPLGDLPDVREHLRRVEKEGILDGVALREVATILRASSELAHYFARHRDALGPLAARHPDLGGGEPVVRRIEKAIDATGEVTDDASADVAEARDRVRGLHGRLRRTAEEMTHSTAWTERLQEPYFSVRGDRYVLPVKAAYRYQVGGIVHNVSNTGETVFIEPPDLITLGNELAVAVSEEEEAVRRVLAELTGVVRGRTASITGDLAAMGEVDALEAAARLSADLDATAPDLADGENASFDLKALRHPLLVLQGKRVVENDVRFEAEARCLVVSGPNAGGKTVTVTAVALSCLMLRHGLPIPAAPGSILPMYRDVLAVLGDEQDLARDLSTFTAHLSALREVLDDAGPGILVLVDEICADTDPREGAALAAGVLETLLDRGAHVLVTTHFEALKALAAGDARYLAAAVGFDAEKMQPTYRLRLHVSGGSSAVEVAARIGLPEEVVTRARAHLSGDGGALSGALDALEARAARAEAEADRLRALQAEAEAERARLAAARHELEDAKRQVRGEGRAELLEEIEAMRREVKATVARLQAEPKMREAAETERALDAAEAEVRTAGARDEEAAAGAGPTGDDEPGEDGRATERDDPAAELVPGTFVRAPTLDDREGEVVDVDGRTAQVAFGALKMRLPLDRLVPLKRPARRAAQAKMASTSAEKAARVEKMRAAPAGEGREDAMVDLRGMRVDDAVAMLDKRLDELLAAGASRVRVIHGHGTGALKRAVREHLAISPHVAATEVAADDDGGDGATWVRL